MRSTSEAGRHGLASLQGAGINLLQVWDLREVSLLCVREVFERFGGNVYDLDTWTKRQLSGRLRFGPS